VKNFIVQPLSSKLISIFGGETQTRSFCYVTDNIRAMQCVMETQSDEFRVFNAGNPDEYSVIELFETVAKLAHTSPIV
jgi:UDP-glucuronate decarboxylase